MGASVEDCEDAVQQAFLELWRRPYEEQDEAATVRYLLRAARNRLLNQLGSDAARWQRDQDHATLEVGADDPVAKLSERECAERVRVAAIQLTREQRQAVEMLDLDGLSATQTAAKIGCTANALHCRRQRANTHPE